MKLPSHGNLLRSFTSGSRAPAPPGGRGDLCASVLRVRRGGDVVRAAALRSVRVRGLNFSAAAVRSPPGYQVLRSAESRLDWKFPPNPRRSHRNDAAVEPKTRKKEVKAVKRRTEWEKRGARDDSEVRTNSPPDTFWWD